MPIDTRSIVTPWSSATRAYSSPRRIVVKLRLGEDPASIAAMLDVRAKAQRPAASFGLEGVDRVLRRFTDDRRVERVYSAAKNLRRPSVRHLGWNEHEHLTGMSRTFRVDCCKPVPVEHVLDALRQDSRVEWAMPYYYCIQSSFAEASATQTIHDEARDLIAAPEALEFEPGDPAVIVAVVDTGVRLNHPAYRGKLRPGWDSVRLRQRDLAGITLLGDSSRSDATPADDVGHGTACAAILGADVDSLPPGMAGRCSILPIRVLGAARAPAQSVVMGVGAITDIDAGMKMAVDLFARVINMSFGTPASAIGPGEPLPHSDVVRYALDRDCILVAASGNSGVEERYTPACLSGVLAVGACDCRGEPTHFSTRGTHVQLSAPGDEILTAGLDHDRTASGTSFAAPFVTGVAALMISRALRRSLALTPAQAMSHLRQSARPWRTGVAGGNGAGVLNARAALESLEEEITRCGVLDDDDTG